MKRKKYGICRLTGHSGQYVKSHIIPKALTRPELPGLPFTQSGKGERPVRRWSSWTDDCLVIRKGEDILEALDSWAISVLRTHKLVWSGWNGADTLTAKHTVFDDEGRGFRIINGIESGRMRLFLLSLLWRAAASDIPEMSEVILPESDLEALRLLVFEGDPGPIAFYPAQLIQLSTRGVAHNFTPFAQIKTIPLVDPEIQQIDIPIFRFYFDGLVVHFHRHATDDGHTAKLGNLVVGNTNEITISTIPFKVSFQAENLLRLVVEAETEFPVLIDRLAWPPKR